MTSIPCYRNNLLGLYFGVIDFEGLCILKSVNFACNQSLTCEILAGVAIEYTRLEC